MMYLVFSVVFIACGVWGYQIMNSQHKEIKQLKRELGRDGYPLLLPSGDVDFITKEDIDALVQKERDRYDRLLREYKPKMRFNGKDTPIEVALMDFPDIAKHFKDKGFRTAGQVHDYLLLFNTGGDGNHYEDIYDFGGKWNAVSNILNKLVVK